MSYAEMEGIVPEPEQVLFELERDELTRTRRIELGLALGFGSLVGGVLVLHVGYVLWTTMQ